MKLLIATILTLNGLTALAQQSVQVENAQHNIAGQNTLVLTNNTNRKIKASFVYYDKGCACLISRGWRIIPPYESNTISIDGLNIGSSVMYVHAERHHRKWGDTQPFYMNQSGVPLEFADRKHWHHPRKMFTQVNISAGQNSFTFNP